jgi:hypothetical protein
VLGAMACFCSPYLTGERTPDLPNSTGIFKGTYAREFHRSSYGSRSIRGRDFWPRLWTRALPRTRYASR